MAVEELYHDGTTITTTRDGDVVNNTQSSMADLLILHTRELALLDQLQSEHLNLISQEFSEDGYDLESVLQSDIHHPVDAYNLIKRTAR